MRQNLALLAEHWFEAPPRSLRPHHGSLAISGSDVALECLPKPICTLARRQHSCRSGSPSVSHTSKSRRTSTSPTVCGVSLGLSTARPNADSIAMPTTPAQKALQRAQPVHSGFSLRSIVSASNVARSPSLLMRLAAVARDSTHARSRTVRVPASSLVASQARDAPFATMIPRCEVAGSAEV